MDSIASRNGLISGHFFLVTYQPLIKTFAGREAVRQHSLSPFIDGSCRREPDFESLYPSITATCRAGKFVPRLQVGDLVVYLTVKGKYPRYRKSGWCLVAILRVIRKFPSHGEAASWYEQQGCSVPSNCFVPGNEPKAFELTNGNPPKKIKERASRYNDSILIRLWDRTYRSRITEWPVLLATKPEFLELNNPPLLSESTMITIFGKIPGTQNPPEINREQFYWLERHSSGIMDSD